MRPRQVISLPDRLPRRIARICLLVAVVITGAVNYAHAESNEVSIGPAFRALRSDSANAVTSESYAGGAVSYARALPVSLARRLEVWAAGSIGWGGATGEMFGTMSTEVRQLAFTAGGRARFALHSRVAAIARADLGTARTSLAIDAGGREAEDRGWGAIASTAVGVEMLALDRPPFVFGMRLELGYVAASAVQLTPTVDDADGTIHLPSTESPIGHLGLGGPSIGFALFSRF